METKPIEPDGNDEKQPVMEAILDTVEDGKKMIRIVKPALIFLISSLGIAALVLIFRLGHGIWPEWIIEYRRQILGIVLFALFGLSLGTPIMIEATVNTKPLVTPEKTYYHGPWS
jgi:hypothetical protein